MFEELDLKIGEGNTGDNYVYTTVYTCPRPTWYAVCHSNSSCAGTGGKYCC